jgi:hypothetical protein
MHSVAGGGVNSKRIQSLMRNEILDHLRGWKARLGGLNKEKTNIIRVTAILILSMGVFFYPNSTKTSIAEGLKPKAEISLSEMIPDKKIGTFIYTSPKKEKSAVSCADKKIIKPVSRLDEKETLAIVVGHPIAEMTPYITKRNKQVASFLLAIAKKESDWGVYSPKKSGRECYNYWGYRGTYNQTESGYSCFDSPEQAVKEVGDKIEKLLGQEINTPSQMIVWKCGRTCAGHDPAGVQKWISDVALYYGKFNS